MWKFIAAYFKANFAATLEYRTSFLTQVFGMMINDSLWVLFWTFYFKRFPVLNGWTFDDLVVLWATITFSFGLAFGLFANIMRLHELISQGQLDYYLTLPKNVLIHMAVAQIRPANLGDMFFGPLLLLLFVQLSSLQWLIYVCAAVGAAIVYLSFFTIIASFTFWLGQSDSLFTSVSNSLVHFSTYPTRIFDGWTRLILFSLIPAGFIAEVPVELVRDFTWRGCATLLGAALGFASLAWWFFHRGLRRYESGNLTLLRS